jgi:hypothetical protein
MRWFFLVGLLAGSGCAHRTRLDCIETCKKFGLNYENVVDTTNGYDAVQRETKTGTACRCGYGKIPQ